MKFGTRMRKISYFEILLGVLFAGFGIYGFYNPNTIMSGLSVVVAIIILLSGINDIMFYFEFDKRTGFGPGLVLIGGIFSVIAGLLMFMNLNAVKVIMTLLFPIWFIAHCISKLGQLPLVRVFSGEASYWLTLIVSIIGIFIGFNLFFDPAASAVSTVVFVSVYLLMSGINNIVNGIAQLSRNPIE